MLQEILKSVSNISQPFAKVGQFLRTLYKLAVVHSYAKQLVLSLIPFLTLADLSMVWNLTEEQLRPLRSSKSLVRNYCLECHNTSREKHVKGYLSQKGWG